MAILKNLPPDAQTQVLWLHHEAFGGDSACVPCKGGCCRNCAHSDGYLNEFGLTEKEHAAQEQRIAATKEKYGWTNDAGFQGEHGCKLPITERSHVCLGFMCGGIGYGSAERGYGGPPKGLNKPFSKEQRAAAERIYDVMVPRKKGR